MSLMLARRSRVVFRHLNVTEPSFAAGRVSLPLRDSRRVAGSSSPLGTSKSGLLGTLLPSIASNSYATAVAKPKAHTGKTKASSKPKKSTSPKASAEKPAKKTAAKTKPKAVGRPKKEVSKEEKDALKEKNEVKELKKAVLKAPKQLPSTVFSVLLSEIIRDKGISGPPAAKEASEAYKNLTSQQRQEHEQAVESNKSLNQAAYEAWVQSHTPLQIKEANRARTKLKKLAAGDSKVTAKGLPKIVDPRQVKAPSNAMMFYSSEQHAAGSFSNLSIAEAAKELSKQFSQLPEHQKEKYNEMAARDKARYYKQYKEVYGVDAPSTFRKDRAEA